MKPILILIQGLCFLSFLWAVPFFFKAPPKINFWSSVIKLAGAISILLDLGASFQSANNDTSSGAVAFVLFLSSLILFWCSVNAGKTANLALAFSEIGNDQIVTWGPYRYIRHPFYLSYMLAWIASAILSPSIPTMIPMFAMGFLYLKAAIAEEKGFKNSPLNESYSIYKSKTPMFFPMRPKSRKLEN